MNPRTISPPPLPFDPVEDMLASGTYLYRVHSLRRGAAEFNPGTDAMTRSSLQGDMYPVARFSFFVSDSETLSPVPVLYAATTVNAALWESLLRNREPGSTEPLPHSAYMGKGLTQIVTARPARIASLAGADMDKLGLPQGELNSCGPEGYVETIPWARAAWEAGFDGIKYVSRQDNSGLAFVFFRRSEQAQLFHPVDSANAVYDFDDPAPGNGFDWLSQRLSRWGITATT